MKSETFTFKSDEGKEIFVYKWLPDENTDLKGIVQIAHGMAEHAARYERLAVKLTNEGFAVYANDHRGHGKSAETVEKQGILADSEGFHWMVEDVHKLTGIIKSEQGALPIFLLGHSMGSFVSQRYIMLYGNELKGVALSGTNGKQGMILKIGSYVAKDECEKFGRDAKSIKLNLMSFGAYNKKFKPIRTEFDWLSRDEEEVDKYIKDPYCGELFPAGFFYDFLQGLRLIEKRKNRALVPKTLSIYMFSGETDPVGKEGKGVRELYNAYVALGIEDVTMKLYKDGRHEILNETNREQVMEDLVTWIKAHLQ